MNVHQLLPNFNMTVRMHHVRCHHQLSHLSRQWPHQIILHASGSSSTRTILYYGIQGWLEVRLPQNLYSGLDLIAQWWESSEGFSLGYLSSKSVLRPS